MPRQAGEKPRQQTVCQCRNGGVLWCPRAPHLRSPTRNRISVTGDRARAHAGLRDVEDGQGATVRRRQECRPGCIRLPHLLMSRPHLDAGEPAVKRQVQADQGVRGTDASPVAANVLGAVGVDGDLMEPHQLDVVQLEAGHLAVELPALGRGMTAGIPLPRAGRQLDAAPGADRGTGHEPMMASAWRG